MNCPVIALAKCTGAAAFCVLAIVGAASAATVAKPITKISPDYNLHAVILPVGKEKGYENYESRVEIRSLSGRLLCEEDFSSEDGEHGYGVFQSQWTADSQFYVVALGSSGGHQPWHHPTLFYSRKLGRIINIEDYTSPELVTQDFTLSAPDIIRIGLMTPGFASKDRTATFKLGSLIATKPATTSLKP
jgi:hypothetical protein